ALFSGGFTLDAAESVVADEALPAAAVLDLLAGLVDRSLLSMRECHGEARYTLLETVRQYAEARLAAGAGEGRGEALERRYRRHALVYAAFAERAAVELHRPAQIEWTARLDAEHDNLRAALRRTIAAGDAELALRLCLGVRDYWRVRGHL